jgi:Carboxypeptidase regulatory-like domain
MRTTTSTTMKTTKRRMKTGSRLLLTATWGLAALIAASGAAAGSKPPTDAYAVIAGTVFREDGFSLRGAEVSIHPDPSAKPKPKIKIRRMNADGRGEFAFRVPPGPMKYTIRAKAAGFHEDAKTVSISNDERVDVFFALKPAAGR